VWVGVDEVVEVVRGQGTVIEWGWGFSLQNSRYRAHTLGIDGRLGYSDQVGIFTSKNPTPSACTRYWWGTGVTCGEGGDDVWVGVDKVVEVVQGWDTVIERWVGFGL
jgi:hypothetical protein